MKVVIVEDERVTREGLAKLLGTMPEVTVLSTCANAREGYEAICSLKPEVVISDIVMADENGLDMIERCREAGITCEFVLLSGYSEFEYARRALPLQVFDYLNKPVSFSAIKDLVRRLQAKLNDERDVMDRSINLVSGNQREYGGRAEGILQNGKLYMAAANFFQTQTRENCLSYGRELCENICQKHLREYYRYMEKHGMNLMLISGEEDMNVYIGAVLAHVKGHLCQTGIDVRLGISCCFQEIGQINEAIAQAVASVQSCALLGKNVERTDLLSYRVVQDPDLLFIREYDMVREQLQRTVEEEIMEAVKGVMETMQSIVPPYIIFAFLLRCVRDICWNAREEKVDWVLNSVSDSISSAPDLEELKKRFRQIVHAEMERLNERPEGSGDDAIGRAISYIRIHYAEPIRSAEVARMFSLIQHIFPSSSKSVWGELQRLCNRPAHEKAQRLLHLAGILLLR